MRKQLSFIIRITVSLALIMVLLYVMRGKYGQILDVLKGASLPVFGIAFAAFIMAIATASFRLMLIIEAQDISITFMEALSLTFIGYFFNNFLPTAIGGDVVKAYYLGKKSRNATGSYTSVFVDRAMGLFTMVLMAFFALLFFRGSLVDNTVRYSVFAITAIAVLGIIFMANKGFARRFSVLLKLVKPLEEKLIKLYHAVNKYRHHWLLMLKTLLISVVSQLMFFASYGILARSIGSRIASIDILVRMPIVSMASLLPSINGLGVREGAMVVFFGPLIGNANAFAVSILAILALLVISLIGGLIYALSPQFKVKFNEIEKGESA